MKEVRLGLRSLRPTRLAGLRLPMALPFVNGAARGGNLDFAPWHAPRGRIARGFRPGEPLVRRKVLAGRKPLLWLRFAGSLLLRLDERAFNTLLLNEPPRNRRLL